MTLIGVSKRWTVLYSGESHVLSAEELVKAFMRIIMLSSLSQWAVPQQKHFTFKLFSKLFGDSVKSVTPGARRQLWLIQLLIADLKYNVKAPAVLP